MVEHPRQVKRNKFTMFKEQRSLVCKGFII